MKRLTVLGCTGSIGVSTLDVVRRSPEKFSIFALVAGANAELLATQILEFRPKAAIVATRAALDRLIKALDDFGVPRKDRPELGYGPAKRVQAAIDSQADFVLSAIVGVEGLEATFEAVRRGKTVGLANKEVLVASGGLVMEAARAAKTELIPVDSEHNGAHQCLRAGSHHEVERLILTASGGPFRDTPAEALSKVTPEQALDHPTWKMGRRITIDSATLMNKGFEVIEACWLFNFSPDRVDVVVHPQSSVHAMVEYADGSVIAQISAADMRMPIQYALTYPDRASSPVARIDWTLSRSWHFSAPDTRRFPLLRLAYEAQRAGGSACCTLNAADEVAVEAFLKGELSFTGIAEVVEDTLGRVPVRHPNSVGAVLEIDRESRDRARQIVNLRRERLSCAAS